MNNREMLVKLEEEMQEVEKKIVGKILTQHEIKEAVAEGLKWCRGIYIPAVQYTEIEENCDSVRVIIDNEVYPDLIIGYDYKGENDEFVGTGEVEFIDLDFGEDDY